MAQMIKLVVEAVYTFKAATLWLEMTDDDRVAIRFGMYPFAMMQQAVHDGFDYQRLTQAINERAASGDVRMVASISHPSYMSKRSTAHMIATLRNLASKLPK